MIQEERLGKITDFVTAHQYANIEELVQLTGVSKATIRRDLIELEEKGKVCFVRGGVSSVGKKILHESVYHVKETENMLEKQRIGERAGKLVNAGDTIFISAGTTCRTMVPTIRTIPNLNVVTNDLMVAVDMADCVTADVVVTGGQLRKQYYTLRGFAAEDQVRGMKLDTAFMSCDAVDVFQGCYIANADEVGLLRQLIASSNRVVLLADHTKFSSSAFVSVCDLDAVDVLITDTGLSRELADALSKQEIELILA